MSYSDPRICHHQRVTQWLAAIRQHAAWLYAADEQYLYLVGEANELYQCGVIGLQDRHDMVTDALGMYSWAIEHGITRETHYCSDCCYDVLDGGVVVGSVDDEGIYHGPAPARQRLGYLGRDPLDGITTCAWARRLSAPALCAVWRSNSTQAGRCCLSSRSPVTSGHGVGHHSPSPAIAMPHAVSFAQKRNKASLIYATSVSGHLR